MISDFTTNLIKAYLLEYTSVFALRYINSSMIRKVYVNRAFFSYETERWMPKDYVLPIYADDFVIITPKDILTKDDTWINHGDMIHRFEDIPDAVENDQLRAEINNYFNSKIPEAEEPTKEDYEKAVSATIEKYPIIIDYYIKMKEDTGEEALVSSIQKVQESDLLYIKQYGGLVNLLQYQSSFYNIDENSKDETYQKILYFKDVIENKGGHKIFYGSDDKPIRREKDVHILFRLVWYGTPSDVSREVDDGRGPADYKISRGAKDKTLVEFKLASNSQLKRNLLKQLNIYKKASDAEWGFKVIIYFSEQELIRVQSILSELDMGQDKNIILIDACIDNKPSGSKA